MSLGALIVCLLVTFLSVGHAQKATLTPDPYLTIFNTAGQLVPSACVWTYAAGTTTPVTTWSDVNQLNPNTNPVIAGADGRVLIYLAPSQSYKFTIEQACTPPAHGAVIRTQDNIAAVPAGSQQAYFDDFRLSLTSGTAVTTSDVTAATTLYLAQYVGNRITLFDGSCNATTYNTGQISIAIPATTTTLYDVWVYSNNGTPTLELLAWTSDSSRATTLGACSGRLVKSTDTTRLYVGSVRTTGVSGQTEDSVLKRYLYNYYNRVRRPLFRQESTASWTYISNVTRQANGSTTNQVEIVMGVAESVVDLSYLVVSGDTSAGLSASRMGLGVDSASVFATGLQGGNFVSGAATGNLQVAAVSRLVWSPVIGKHVFQMLEAGSGGGGVQTWYGSGTYANSAVLSGWIEN